MITNKKKQCWQDKKEPCPKCGEPKSKNRKLCQKCFLKELFSNKSRNNKISKALKGRVPWNKGLTKELDKRLIGISEAHKGEKNQNWRGGTTYMGYSGVHKWIKERKIKPEFCELCGKRKSQDLANISGEYTYDINDYRYLCRICHMKSDGRYWTWNRKKKNSKRKLIRRR